MTTDRARSSIAPSRQAPAAMRYISGSVPASRLTSANNRFGVGRNFCSVMSNLTGRPVLVLSNSRTV